MLHWKLSVNHGHCTSNVVVIRLNIKEQLIIYNFAVSVCNDLSVVGGVLCIITDEFSVQNWWIKLPILDEGVSNFG